MLTLVGGLVLLVIEFISSESVFLWLQTPGGPAVRAFFVISVCFHVLYLHHMLAGPCLRSGSAPALARARAHAHAKRGVGGGLMQGVVLLHLVVIFFLLVCAFTGQDAALSMITMCLSELANVPHTRRTLSAIAREAVAAETAAAEAAAAEATAAAEAAAAATTAAQCTDESSHSIDSSSSDSSDTNSNCNSSGTNSHGDEANPANATASATATATVTRKAAHSTTAVASPATASVPVVPTVQLSRTKLTLAVLRALWTFFFASAIAPSSSFLQLTASHGNGGLLTGTTSSGSHSSGRSHGHGHRAYEDSGLVSSGSTGGAGAQRRNARSGSVSLSANSTAKGKGAVAGSANNAAAVLVGSAKDGSGGTKKVPLTRTSSGSAIPEHRSNSKSNNNNDTVNENDTIDDGSNDNDDDDDDENDGDDVFDSSIDSRTAPMNTPQTHSQSQTATASANRSGLLAARVRRQQQVLRRTAHGIVIATDSDGCYSQGTYSSGLYSGSGTSSGGGSSSGGRRGWRSSGSSGRGGRRGAGGPPDVPVLLMFVLSRLSIVYFTAHVVLPYAALDATRLGHVLYILVAIAGLVEGCHLRDAPRALSFFRMY